MGELGLSSTEQYPSIKRVSEMAGRKDKDVT